MIRHWRDFGMSSSSKEELVEVGTLLGDSSRHNDRACNDRNGAPKLVSD